MPPSLVDYSVLTVGHTESGHVIEDVASIQKSVIAFLAGVAEGKGLLDIEAPASKYIGQGWSKATPEQEAQIRVRNLLSMASGLDEDLQYQDTPGEIFMYNTPAYSRTVPVLEKATGGRVLRMAWSPGPMSSDSRPLPGTWLALG